MAQPDFSEAGTLKLTFAFVFHQKRINDNSNRQKIAEIVQELTGQDITIECLYDKLTAAPAQAVTQVDKPLDPNLTAISNIFGDAELLES